MARTQVKLKYPITDVELDIDENGLEFLWIPAEEELPDKDGRVIVAIDLKTIPHSYRIEILYFAKNLEEADPFDFEGRNMPGFYEFDNEWGNVERHNITHWMPLPGLPKRKDN